jgi:hypothetical protein
LSDLGEPERIDPAHLSVVLKGLEQAKRREFATDVEVEAAFARFYVPKPVMAGPDPATHRASVRERK